MRTEFPFCFTSKRFIQVTIKDISFGLLSSLFLVKEVNFFICAKTDEWANFEERIKDSPNKTEELRKWVSYRGQTLSRTGSVTMSTCLIMIGSIWVVLYFHRIKSNNISWKENGSKQFQISSKMHTTY